MSTLLFHWLFEKLNVKRSVYCWFNRWNWVNHLPTVLFPLNQHSLFNILEIRMICSFAPSY